MAGMVAKYAMKKALGKEMEKYKSKDVSGPYDPYYALQPDPKRPHKMKKVKKDIPSYIPENDCVVLAKARKSAYRLDYALFTFMGIRFGWSSVIGLAPAVGDAAGSALALNLVRNMCKVEGGLPASVLIMMLFMSPLTSLSALFPSLAILPTQLSRPTARTCAFSKSTSTSSTSPRSSQTEIPSSPENDARALLLSMSTLTMRLMSDATPLRTTMTMFATLNVPTVEGVFTTKKWADGTTTNPKDRAGTTGLAATTLGAADVDEYFFMSLFLASFPITACQYCCQTTAAFHALCIAHLALAVARTLFKTIP